MDTKTIAGASAFLLVAVNTVQHATGWGERWFALTLAVLIALSGVLIARRKSKAKVKDGFVALCTKVCVNGVLIYASAFGIQNNVVAEVDGPPTMTAYRDVEERVEVPIHAAPADPTRPPIPVPPVYETRIRRIAVRVPDPSAPRGFTSPW